MICIKMLIVTSGERNYYETFTFHFIPLCFNTFYFKKSFITFTLQVEKIA